MMRCFMAADDFIDYCRRVYFSTEDFTLMTFIIVNGGLLYVLEEKAILTRSERALEELWVYHRICRDNMETALAHVTLILPARKETIEALLVGVSQTIRHRPLSARLPRRRLTATYRPSTPSRTPARRSPGISTRQRRISA